jgi:hypothetical protein
MHDNEARTPHPPRPRAAGAVLLAGLLTLLSGCAATPKPEPAKAKDDAPAPADSTESAAVPEAVSDAPVRAPGPRGSIVGSAVSIDFRPLGRVATDGFTLPVPSPDGRLLAVQTGAAPDLATMLARPGQRAPLASRVATYRVDATGLVRLGESDTGLVLGRHADAKGVLVESPRPDGSRWIGRLGWDAREVEWLVQDGRVNAFASFGADGSLAYSSRETSTRRFDLVVRRDGQSSRLSGEGARSYLYPTFDASGSRVFAMCLRDGVLEFASVDPASDESMRQTLTRAFVSDRATDETAAQMLAPQGVRDGVDGKDWLVYHPWLGTLVRWNESAGLRALPGGVTARAATTADAEVVLVGGRVRARTALADATTVAREPGTIVYDELAVPRALADIDGAPAVLLVVPDAQAKAPGLRLVLARFVRSPGAARERPNPTTPGR